MTNLTKILLYVGLFALPYNGYASAIENIQSWHDHLQTMAHYSPIEGAGSRGTYGTSVGLGIAQIEPTESNILNDQSYGIYGKGSEERIIKSWVIGGTPWPIDWGASLGTLRESSIQTLGAHLQFTIWESFRTPAVAVRTSYAKVLGLKSTETDFSTVEGVFSYGFQFIAAYVTGGMTFGKSSTTLQSNERTILYLSENQPDETFEIKTATPVSAIGFKLKPTPLSSIAVESNVSRNKGHDHAVMTIKLSAGL